jgi:hypothetical protein
MKMMISLTLDLAILSIRSHLMTITKYCSLLNGVILKTMGNCSEYANIVTDYILSRDLGVSASFDKS